MNKLSRILLVFLILTHFCQAAKADKPTPKSSAPVIQILVASWCVHCRDLEKFLQEQGLGYIRLDIEKDPEGKKRYQQLGGGGVPMVIIGNSVMKGFDKNAILEMLEQNSRRVTAGQVI